MKKFQKQVDVKNTEEKTGFFAKIFKRKPKEIAKVENKAKDKADDKAGSDSGFMDLSIPKE